MTEGIFGREFSHMAGGVNNPEAVQKGPIKCKECGVVAEILRRESRNQCSTGFRGTLKTTWTEIHLRCPKCNKYGTYSQDHDEEDVTYCSNEERRVFGD